MSERNAVIARVDKVAKEGDGRAVLRLVFDAIHKQGPRDQFLQYDLAFGLAQARPGAQFLAHDVVHQVSADCAALELLVDDGGAVNTGAASVFVNGTPSSDDLSVTPGVGNVQFFDNALNTAFGLNEPSSLTIDGGDPTAPSMPGDVLDFVGSGVGLGGDAVKAAQRGLKQDLEAQVRAKQQNKKKEIKDEWDYHL